MVWPSETSDPMVIALSECELIHMPLKTVLFSLAILLIVLSQVAFSAEVAITLDDLPYVNPSQNSPDEGLAIVKAVNGALSLHGITATGFVVGGQISRKTKPALQAFIDEGHQVGNHSWTHPDYGTLTVKEFRKEVHKTDRALRGWMGDTKFFRFPYLREGETPEAKADAESVLAALGYVNAPVSIDNDEWRYNSEYTKALAAGDVIRAKAIGTEYLGHIQERTVHFQTLAQDNLGRDVKHILLLHMNKINADYLGDLLDWYAGQGWSFISLKEAMSDPLYSAPDLYAGPRGLSQIERVVGLKSD